VKYTKTTPCDTCPFLRNGLRLHPERAEEIGEMLLSNPGGEFPCHKTITHGDNDEEYGHASLVDRDKEIHCAGALIFAEKNESSTQMMRICQRIGMYKPDGILNSPSWNDVFDDLDEMVEVNVEAEEDQRVKAKENRDKDGY
jgi:hypothetical protein